MDLKNILYSFQLLWGASWVRIEVKKHFKDFQNIQKCVIILSFTKLVEIFCQITVVQQIQLLHGQIMA